MKFVGGPMHGLDVPIGLFTQAHLITYRDPDSFEIAHAVLVKSTVRLVGSLPTKYILSEWFIAPGRALVPYMAWEKLTDENLVRFGRQVFGREVPR